MIISKYQDSPNVNWIIRSKKTNKNYSNIIKTFMGRDAINIFLSNIDYLFKKKTVLLPAYTCTEVSNEFEKHGYTIIYYDINNFKINKKEIEDILNHNNIDIFYLIHYYGIIQNKLQDIIDIVKRKSQDILIIEDRAHYISDRKLLNNTDAIIFSFRKLLPIPEGGGLYTRMKIEYKYRSAILSTFLAIAMILKKIIFGHNPKFSRSKMLVTDTLQPQSTNIFAPSIFSKKIIENFDIETNIKLRRILFYKWLTSIKRSPFMPVFESLNSNDIPQGFPIFVDDAKIVQDKMMRKGIYLKRHWPLDKKFEKIAPRSYELSKHVITLPIYEGINDTDIDFIIEQLLQIEFS